MQMARFGGAMRVDKKGAIDLVTEVDVAVERMFRALVAERFPDHQVLAEEMGGDAAVPRGPVLGVRSDRRHDEFRARAADLLLVARARNRRRRRSRGRLRSEPPRTVHGRARRRRVSERPAAARVGARRRSSTRMLVTGFPVRRPHARRRDRRPVRRVRAARRARSGGSGRRRSICATSRRGAWTASGKATSSRGTSPAAR